MVTGKNTIKIKFKKRNISLTCPCTYNYLTPIIFQYFKTLRLSLQLPGASPVVHRKSRLAALQEMAWFAHRQSIVGKLWLFTLLFLTSLTPIALIHELLLQQLHTSVLRMSFGFFSATYSKWEQRRRCRALSVASCSFYWPLPLFLSLWLICLHLSSWSHVKAVLCLYLTENIVQYHPILFRYVQINRKVHICFHYTSIYLKCEYFFMFLIN